MRCIDAAVYPISSKWKIYDLPDAKFQNKFIFWLFINANVMEQDASVIMESSFNYNLFSPFGLFSLLKEPVNWKLSLFISLKFS